ncbi:helix-hairpin-helix domain-containing protein [Colwellia sp. MB02u-6]|jgi:competence protein ComEA|uniref:ComEA family DNA-binding protein n=1 Tax=Colwellia sp. MB02u-6 TaxID=2759824 RepID=UPI0015F64EA2|nr:helix-hairpin-helix domain-containing protein [Colwellia sp. MB02u-6]MBA6327429.1 helix-hairpin-helix domain-containing protein [Colwellia sp. MB02u-6]
MKKHICYSLVILFTVMSLPLQALVFNETPAVISSQEIQAIDINKAGMETLALLKGVGAKRAKAIIAYRELNGEFKSLDDLKNVRGVGQRTLDLNKGRIKL